MVFTPVDPVIKEKVLAKYLAGYGRNQIDRELRKEVAQMQSMGIKDAAILVAQELRLNRQFGGIQRQIEIAQGQLKMLNMITAEKERSVLSQNKGVSDGPGADNGQKTNIGKNPTMGQYLFDSFSSHPGNNGIKNQGSSNGGISNNGYGNFSMNDFIRLNLLKSSTTNMLNRMSPQY